MKSNFRVGHGVDVHRFGKGRRLILGGIHIPYSYGLIGHSDADVILHALMNAILGALGKGDIGTHFPDTDQKNKGISSEVLMKKVLGMMSRAGYHVINGDVSVLAQKPRIAPYYPEIRKRLAKLLKVSSAAVNVKAGTTEKLGWVGKGQGMAAMAVVLLQKIR
ncbi:MAG: 2-C-methyl-D-erythritol 2,4-cyclodiphosphate synthase [Deltaproteobacteria bacterium]|nr:2-C-methyl-D-erythritol 2,4-cyclodiphosphate synthase [Deltaproteobacteria bacterium]